jgi:hypothetical protein
MKQGEFPTTSVGTRDGNFKTQGGVSEYYALAR